MHLMDSVLKNMCMLFQHIIDQELMQRQFLTYSFNETLDVLYHLIKSFKTVEGFATFVAGNEHAWHCFFG